MLDPFRPGVNRRNTMLGLAEIAIVIVLFLIIFGPMILRLRAKTKRKPQNKK